MKAKQRNRPVTYRDVLACADACTLIQQARDQLRTAGANNAANYCARALKSAIGAHNNARAHFARQQRQEVSK